MAEADGSRSRVALSIIIPACDEAANLAVLVAEIENVLPRLPAPAEVLIVDDGSRDESWRLIGELAASRSWLRGIRFLTNRGQTAAMAAGIDAARGDLVAFLDADLQNDPNDLPNLIAPIAAGDADVVCGWRAHRNDSVLTRTVPSIVANVLIRSALHLNVHDVGCTLKVFRRPYIEDVALFGEMHRFLPAYAQAQGARIGEVVVNHRPRTAGTSKYGIGRSGKVLIDLLTVKMLSGYGSSPAYFFGRVAAFFFLLGTAAFSVVAYRAFVLGHVESTPLIFIMTLLYVAGLISLMSGLLAELNVRVLHQVGGQRRYKIIERIGFGQDEESR
jgi:glycosyltransferase involved in cell wall biosynthesis